MLTDTSFLKTVLYLFLMLFLCNSHIFACDTTPSLNVSNVIDNGDGTITDTKTNLMWMKKDSYLHSGHWHNWPDSHNYVRQLNNEGFAQYFDWQMPTTKELKTL